jgi:hypothetical protein
MYYAPTFLGVGAFLYLRGMAFKKKDYKEWFKFFHSMIFDNGANPYLLQNEFIPDLIKQDEFEGAKAGTDVFNEWHEKFGLNEKQTKAYLTEFYNNHPIYGQGKKFA